MPYADRRVLDADAHLMEPAGWLESYVDPAHRDAVPPMDGGDPEFSDLLAGAEQAAAERAADPDAAAEARRQLMTMPRKGWPAFGAWDRAERTAALDELGFELQVVYPTGAYPQVATTKGASQVAAAIGMNRGLAEFCSDDPRLLATAYVPFRHGPDVARDVLRRAVALGTRVVMVDMIPAKGAQAPSHPDFDPFWADLVEAGVLCSVHIGLDAGWRPVRSELFDNGRSLPHFRSDAPGDALSYMSIGYPAELFLSCLVLDGVLERHPGLRISVAELGAVWVPGFLHHLDQSFRAFRRLQDLSHLSLAPSEYIRRQVRFTPFAGEPVGWMMATSEPSLYVFSSDYPHHEGSDDPIRRFDATMADVSPADRDRFYADTFEALLAEVGVPVPGRGVTVGDRG